MEKENFRILFNKHFESVRNYIYYRCGDQDLATDVAQETFMRIWEKQLLNTPEKIVGLLFKIASDLFVSNYRKQQVDLKFRNGLTENELDYSPEDSLEYSELKAKYEKAISNLSEKQRIVFLMSRNDELKYSEIAQRLDISVKAVEKRMTKAISELKQEMKDFF